MRVVNFEGKKHKITISANNYKELQERLAKQLIQYNKHREDAKNAVEKQQELLVKFKDSKGFRRERIAQKVYKHERTNKFFERYVQSFQILYLYIIAYSLLEPLHGKNKYKKWWHKLFFKNVGYKKFIKTADLEEIKAIADELESVMEMKTLEEYRADKKKQMLKLKKKRNKQIRKLQVAIR